MSAIEPTDAVPVSESCYRHPDRVTGVTCQRCDRLVCGECGVQASVGVHCPECRKGTTQKVYTARNMPGQDFIATRVLVGINVAVMVATIVFFGSTITRLSNEAVQYSTFGPLIAEGELWRIFSGGFLHDGLMHIGFNMYLLWALGRMLEKELGVTEFVVAYFVSMVGGSLGAILLDPTVPVVGASGAVFGLIAMAVMSNRSRGIGLFDSGLGFLVVINILFSFRGGISLGGHLGGFVIGLTLGALYFGIDPGEGPGLERGNKRIAITVAFGLLLMAATYGASLMWENPILG